MVRIGLSPQEYLRARRILIRRDPVLAGAIRRVGPCLLGEGQQADHLTALIQAIVSQQLSTKAASTIFARFLALFPERATPDPRAIADVDTSALRGVGLSGQKVSYLRDLCSRIDAGQLRLDELDALDDEQVIERLVEVKGLGRWTAEMFLIFRLHRPDVLPVGDLGIVKAVHRLYRLRTRPDPARLIRMGEAWRPYRSVASWYLWQSLKLDVTAGSATSTTATAIRRR